MKELNSKSFENASGLSRIYREILVSILRLTLDGPVSRTLLSIDAGVPSQVTDEVLEKFFAEGLIRLSRKVVEASLTQRIKIAIRAFELRADFERVCGFLGWQEFENIAVMVFEANNFVVEGRFRFFWASRKWEIDVVGCRKPVIVCADCKHWHRGWGRSAVTKAVDAQIERTKALAEILHTTSEVPERLGLVSWREGTLIPLILSLVPGSLRFHRRTPVVPILQLQDLLDRLPVNAATLMCFHWEAI